MKIIKIALACLIGFSSMSVLADCNSVLQGVSTTREKASPTNDGCAKPAVANNPVPGANNNQTGKPTTPAVPASAPKNTAPTKKQ